MYEESGKGLQTMLWDETMRELKFQDFLPYE